MNMAYASVSTFTLRLIKDRTVRYKAAVVDNGSTSATVLRAFIGERDCEHLAVLLLDAGMRPIGLHTVAVGNLHGVAVAPRHVFKAAIVGNAHAIVLGHNHPSGNPKPSPEDIAFTKEIVRLGQALGIQVVDHVIVTTDYSHSMHAHGEGGF